MLSPPLMMVESALTMAAFQRPGKGIAHHSCIFLQIKFELVNNALGHLGQEGHPA